MPTDDSGLRRTVVISWVITAWCWLLSILSAGGGVSFFTFVFVGLAIWSTKNSAEAQEFYSAIRFQKEKGKK